MSTSTQPEQEKKWIGFQDGNLSWSEYARFRPVYPPSFYNNIYNHHKASLLKIAHDVGAGAGIASRRLAERFDNVIVTEPNEKYLQAAIETLSSLPFPKDKFTYLLEGAEKSSVESGSVDVITICEALHWTDSQAAVTEFTRQLKSGGTLSISLYTPCIIIGNVKAQKYWTDHWWDIGNSMLNHPTKGSAFKRAAFIISTALENLAFEEDVWESGVERRYTNLEGDVASFAKGFFNAKGLEDEVDRVGKGDKKIWIEKDEDWMTKGCDFDWFKNASSVFLPGLPANEEIWKGLEQALDGGNVDVAWPHVQVIATKK